MVNIENETFQSLYYPFLSENTKYAVILESDQHYYKALETFKANMIAISSLLTIAVLALILSLILIRRKTESAIAMSNHQERLAFLGRASAELAHELKNPLGIIKSSIDVLRRKFDPDGSQKPFDFMSDEVMRLSRLLDKILSFSRERVLLKDPFSAHTVLSVSLAAVKIDFPNAKTDLIIPENIFFIGDIDAFRQISDNIIKTP